MKAYGMSYRDVLTLPIRTFWSLNKQIARLQAERDMRLMLVVQSGMTGGAELAQSLKEEIGTPIVSIDNRRDENATEQLREALRG